MKSLEELKAIRDKARQNINVRGESEAAVRIVVGMATCGIAAGARPVLNAFADEADAQLSGQIEACLENVVRGIEMRGVNGKSVVDLSDEEAEEAREMVERAEG